MIKHEMRLMAAVASARHEAEAAKQESAAARSLIPQPVLPLIDWDASSIADSLINMGVGWEDLEVGDVITQEGQLSVSWQQLKNGVITNWVYLQSDTEFGQWEEIPQPNLQWDAGYWVPNLRQVPGSSGRAPINIGSIEIHINDGTYTNAYVHLSLVPGDTLAERARVVTRFIAIDREG